MYIKKRKYMNHTDCNHVNYTEIQNVLKVCHSRFSHLILQFQYLRVQKYFFVQHSYQQNCHLYFFALSNNAFLSV